MKDCPQPLSNSTVPPAVRRDVFQAVADPIRRRVLESLARSTGGLSIAAITKELPITRTAVNKPLALLSDAGLVQAQKVGRETRYRLTPEPLLQLTEWLPYVDQYWNKHLASLPH